MSLLGGHFHLLVFTWGRTATYINAATQQGTTFQGLLQDLIEVLGCLSDLEGLSHSPSEVFHGLDGAAPLQCLVTPVKPTKMEEQTG